MGGGGGGGGESELDSIDFKKISVPDIVKILVSDKSGLAGGESVKNCLYYD